jgi:SAM-dependent methyltransferase
MRDDIDIPDYGEVWAPVYDDLYGAQIEVAPLASLFATLMTGRNLLEFGVGTGRVALALAQKGWNVSGIELSREMVDLLRKKAGGDRLDVKLGDFTTTGFGKTFDIVLLNFSTLFLLRSQEDQVRCFKNAAQHLETGGCFVVETFVPDHSRWTRGQNVSVASLSPTEVDLLAAKHDRAMQTILAQHVVIGQAGMRMQPTFYRYAWPAEIDLMAQLAGLRLKERWAGYDRTPYTSDSGQHVSVYAKA